MLRLSPVKLHIALFEYLNLQNETQLQKSLTHYHTTDLILFFLLQMDGNFRTKRY